MRVNMGLAERFRQNLEKRDIFKNMTSDEILCSAQLKYVSKPITSEITIKSQKIHSEILEQPFENLVELEKSQKQDFYMANNKLEDLETEIIAKIRKTPYWSEFTKSEQANMIAAYFDKKTSFNKYKHLSQLPSDRLDFIQNILTLSNNK